MPTPLRRESSRQLDRIVGSLVSSRGCPFYCSFCDIQTFYRLSKGKLWRQRSPSKVVDEIEQLISLGAEHIMFHDDTFMVDAKHAEGICNEILKRGLHITWRCETRADLLLRNRDLLPLLRLAGCNGVFMGVESASPSQLSRYAKGTSVEMNKKAIELLKENSLLHSIGFIMFDPNCSLNEILDNVRFAKENDIPLQDAFNHIVPLPNTPIYEKAVKLQIVNSADVFKDYYETFDSKVYFQDPTVEKLYDMTNEWITHLKNLEDRQIQLDLQVKSSLKLIRSSDSRDKEFQEILKIVNNRIRLPMFRAQAYELLLLLLSNISRPTNDSQVKKAVSDMYAWSSAQLTRIEIFEKEIMEFQASHSLEKNVAIGH